MITRVWRCDVVPERADELIDWIELNSWPRVRTAPGFIGGALYLPMDGKDTIVTASHWVDGTSIGAYAGEDWRGTPVVYDYERAFLVGEPSVEHFVRAHEVQPVASTER